MNPVARHIVAMGGGGFSMEPDNLALDRYALSLTGSAVPRACFLPTASADSESYVERFTQAFKSLGCVTSSLSLFKPHTQDIESFILAQDLIYVGGGNTRNLLALWRDWGLDTLIRRAYENGTILAGLSAGANCWFDEFSTDSMGGLAPWAGLGWLRGSFCPHYDGEQDRRPWLENAITIGTLKSGFAADDGAAIHFINEQPSKFIASRPNAGVYAVQSRDGRFEEVRCKMDILDKNI
jgi:dipeptidase E